MRVSGTGVSGSRFDEAGSDRSARRVRAVGRLDAAWGVVAGVAIAAMVAGEFLLAPVSGSSALAVWLESVARVSVVVVPVAVGLYVWGKLPFGRIGALLASGGLVWLVATSSLANQSVAYSVGRVAEWIGWVVIVYLLLAFPEGTLEHWADRVLVGSFAAVVALLYLPTVLLVSSYPTPSDWVTCSSNCPPNAFMAVAHQPGVINSVVAPLRLLLVVTLSLALIGRLVWRIAIATRIRRRVTWPVLTVGAVGLATLCWGLIAREVSPHSTLVSVLRWVIALALPTIAVAFLIGLLGWRLYVGRALRRLAAAMHSGLEPDELRAAFADAFDDPALSFVYPVGDDGWATADGRPAAPPSNGRSALELMDTGERLVAVIHDSTLDREPAFVDAVASYASLLLENQRLDGDLQHTLRGLREAQARASESADRVRVQIERDLHDSAQQRLIGLRLKLQLAAEEAAGEPRLTARLARLGDEVDLIIHELRTLARGVFPQVLSDLGPVTALRGAALGAPIPTRVIANRARRYEHPVERALYFCCLEALQNIYKHAPTATRAEVKVIESDDQLRFEVTDDGGGFDPEAVESSLGLDGMRDRLAGVGGTLTIRSSPGRGTEIIGTIPLREE